MMRLKIIELYTIYVVAHNREPEGFRADTTFDRLYEEIQLHYDEDDTQYMIDTLCTVDNNGKITMAENLKAVFVNGLF